MKKVRELFAKYVYVENLVGKSTQEYLKELEDVSEEEKKLLENLIEFYVENKQELIRRLTEILVGWEADRLLYLDKAAILAGMCEILLGEEFLEVLYDYGTFARIFSTEDSPRFVMGVLKNFKEVLR